MKTLKINWVQISFKEAKTIFDNSFADALVRPNEIMFKERR